MMICPPLFFPSRWLLRMGLVVLLTLSISGFSLYLYLDHRSDQWRTLAQTISINDTEGLRADMKEGAINREDFPKMLLYCVEIDLPGGVENLIAVGVNVNTRDEQGHSALYLARKLNHVEIAKMLYAAGAKE